MEDNDELLEIWAHLPIKELLRASEEYIVFINKDDKFDWEIKDSFKQNSNYVEKRFNSLLSKESELEIQEAALAGDDVLFRFRQLLANILVNIFRADYESAERAIKYARDFILRNNFEITRIWSLFTTIIFSTVIFVVALFLENNSCTGVLDLFCKSLYGVVGVAICSFFVIKKKFVFVETGKFKVVVESIAREIIGIFCAFLGLLCFKEKLIFSQLHDLGIPNIEIIVAIFSGASETFFPNLLGKLDKEQTF